VLSLPFNSSALSKKKKSKQQETAATRWITEQKTFAKPRSIKDTIHRFGLDKPEISSAESEETEPEDPDQEEQTARRPSKRHKAQPRVPSDKKKEEPEVVPKVPVPVYVQTNIEPGVPVPTPQQTNLINELLTQLASKKRQEEEEVQVVSPATTGPADSESTIASLRLQLCKTEEALRQKEIREDLENQRLWQCVGATVAAAARPSNRPPQTLVPPPGAQLPQQPV
jgi:hypothetical protein